MSSIPVLDDIPVTVITIADLRVLVNHRNNEIVRVRSTENDFRFDSSSFAVDDGISVVRPINVSVLHPGRWLVIVYPVNVAVGGWTVIFTRKAPNGTPDDSGWVDTGLVYDPNYEYAFYGNTLAGPTPDPTAPTMELTVILAEAVPIKGRYKPDGITSIGAPLRLLYSSQNLAAMGVNLSMLSNTLFQLEYATGKINTKWAHYSTQDGHWCIARRRRYG